MRYTAVTKPAESIWLHSQRVYFSHFSACLTTTLKACVVCLNVIDSRMKTKRGNILASVLREPLNIENSLAFILPAFYTLIVSH